MTTWRKTYTSIDNVNNGYEFETLEFAEEYVYRSAD